MRVDKEEVLKVLNILQKSFQKEKSLKISRPFTTKEIDDLLNFPIPINKFLDFICSMWEIQQKSWQQIEHKILYYLHRMNLEKGDDVDLDNLTILDENKNEKKIEENNQQKDKKEKNLRAREKKLEDFQIQSTKNLNYKNNEKKFKDGSQNNKKFFFLNSVLKINNNYNTNFNSKEKNYLNNKKIINQEKPFKFDPNKLFVKKTRFFGIPNNVKLKKPLIEEINKNSNFNDSLIIKPKYKTKKKEKNIFQFLQKDSLFKIKKNIPKSSNNKYKTETTNKKKYQKRFLDFCGLTSFEDFSDKSKKKAFISLNKNKLKNNFNPSYSYDKNKSNFSENYFLPQFSKKQESISSSSESYKEDIYSSQNNCFFEKQEKNDDKEEYEKNLYKEENDKNGKYESAKNDKKKYLKKKVTLLKKQIEKNPENKKKENKSIFGDKKKTDVKFSKKKNNIMLETSINAEDENELKSFSLNDKNPPIINFSEFLIKLFMKKGIYNKISFKYFFTDFGHFMLKLKEKKIVELFFENKTKLIKRFKIFKIDLFLLQTIKWIYSFIKIPKTELLNFLKISKANIINK